MVPGWVLIDLTLSCVEWLVHSGLFVYAICLQTGPGPAPAALLSSEHHAISPPPAPRRTKQGPPPSTHRHSCGTRTQHATFTHSFSFYISLILSITVFSLFIHFFHSLSLPLLHSVTFNVLISPSSTLFSIYWSPQFSFPLIPIPSFSLSFPFLSTLNPPFSPSSLFLSLSLQFCLSLCWD